MCEVSSESGDHVVEVLLAVVVTAVIFGGLGFLAGVILMSLAQDRKIGRDK